MSPSRRTRSTITSSELPLRERLGADVVEVHRAAVDQQAREAFASQQVERGPHRIRLDGAAPVAGRLAPPRASAARLALVARVAIGSCHAAAAHDRHLEAEEEARAVRQRAELVGHRLGGFAHHVAAAVPAHGPADAREQQPQIVVDLRRRADRRARVADAVLLADGNRRRHALDAVDVGPLHALEELARVGRQRLDVAALPFGVDGVEGERRLARPADAGHDREPARRERHVDVLQVVRPRAADDDGTEARSRVYRAWLTSWSDRVAPMVRPSAGS